MKSQPNPYLTQPWQQQLANGIGDAQTLLDALELPTAPFSIDAHQQFRTKVPWGFVARMQRGDSHDPLLRQVLPLVDEDILTPGYVKDPLQERDKNPIPGLLHKYHGRVLLTFTGSCAINCRYCFRRHFDYDDNNPGQIGWQRVWRYIADDPSIQEVIFSGGEPLLANDKVWDNALTQIENIAHVTTVRIHSRMPIVLPARITPEWLQRMQQSRLHVVMVLHCNHAQEIDNSVAQACAAMRAAGIHCLNQSVLLQGVNDNAQTLIDLSHALFAIHVLPYYLHQLDKVQGTAHFDVPLDQAHEIYKTLQENLPGYLVPRWVVEEPGEAHKVSIP